MLWSMGLMLGLFAYFMRHGTNHLMRLAGWFQAKAKSFALELYSIHCEVRRLKRLQAFRKWFDANVPSRIKSARTISFTILLMLFSVQAFALPCTVYLDPQWGGAAVGTAAQPYITLGSTEKTAINSALLLADVYLCISSRLAGSDADNVYGSPSEIDLAFRADVTSHVLTLDGIAYYNVSEVTPAWTTSGRTICAPLRDSTRGCSNVRDIVSQNGAATLYNYISIIGFRVTATTSTKGMSLCGSHLVIYGNDISQNGGNGQPGFQLVPTADAAHEGSGSPCGVMTDLEISYNTIHDTYAEVMYLGGGGCSSNDPDAGPALCQGFPSHHDIRIHHNELYNGATHGTLTDQGDGIDIKGGFYDLYIHDNNIHHLTDILHNGVRCIAVNGKRLADPEQNIQIYNNTCKDNVAWLPSGSADAQIILSDSWGRVAGAFIFNNKIINPSDGEAYHVYDCTAHCYFLNNIADTIPDLAITVVAGGANNIIKNNAFLTVNGGGNVVSYSASVVSTNNVHNGSAFGGTCSSGCVSGLSATAGVDFVNPPTGDFHIASASSKLYGAGANLTSLGVSALNSDYVGIARPSGGAWDAGIYQFSSGAGPSVLLSAAMMMVLVLFVFGLSLGIKSVANPIIAETKTAELVKWR